MFLSLLLFNLVGYRIFYGCLIYQNRQRISRKIEKQDLPRKDLVELKIPLGLPYPTNWQGTEVIEGEIELNGVHYNFVKRKFLADTMYLYCLPNAYRTQLEEGLDDYVAQGLGTGRPDSAPAPVKIMLECDFELFAGALSPVLPLSPEVKKYSPRVYNLYDGFAITPAKPPELPRTA